jgi:hypothetical protein
MLLEGKSDALSFEHSVKGREGGRSELPTRRVSGARAEVRSAFGVRDCARARPQNRDVSALGSVSLILPSLSLPSVRVSSYD